MRRAIISWIRMDTRKLCDCGGCWRFARWERVPSEGLPPPKRRQLVCDEHFPTSREIVEHRQEDW